MMMVVIEKGIPIPGPAPRKPISKLAARAYYLVRIARRQGKLVPQPCEVCGAERVHGHHDDYNKPLELRWLCPLHHNRHHACRPDKKTLRKIKRLVAEASNQRKAA